MFLGKSGHLQPRLVPPGHKPAATARIPTVLKFSRASCPCIRQSHKRPAVVGSQTFCFGRPSSLLFGGFSEDPAIPTALDTCKTASCSVGSYGDFSEKPSFAFAFSSGPPINLSPVLVYRQFCPGRTLLLPAEVFSENTGSPLDPVSSATAENLTLIKVCCCRPPVSRT